MDLQLRHPSSAAAADLRAYPAIPIAQVVAVLAEQGVAAAQVLAGSGLQESELRDPALRLSTRQWLQVYSQALRLSRDPELALRAGSRMHAVACGMLGYALLSSPSHQAAVELLSKYDRMVSPLIRKQFEIRDGRAQWTLESMIDAPSDHPLVRFSIEFRLTTMLTVGRDLYGASFGFQGVHLMYPAPAHAARFKDWLDCEVSFGQPSHCVWFDARLLAQRMPFPDPIANEAARRLCEEVLAKIPQGQGLADTLHAMLVERPGHFPDLEGMAETLGCNARTLQRRLQAEGKSYRDILAEVRERLAISYLRGTELGSEEIAARLGYREPSSFRHAFARWTGLSPSEYRRKLRG